MQGRGMSDNIRTMHIFAGVGGGLLADLILGHKPIVAVEWEKYPCQVLRERSADGWFPNLRVHECDIRLFDSFEYKGRVDCIHAGFPCQDISNAGNQAGVGEGTRSGLYREVLRISDEVRPKYIFLENVAAIVNGNDGRMLRTVVGDLAERGFDAVWCRLAASQIGARHKRDRWWLLAFPSKQRCDSGRSDRQKRHVQENQERQHPQVQWKRHKWKFRSCKVCSVFSDTHNTRCKKQRLAKSNEQKFIATECAGGRQVKSDLGRVANGFSDTVHPHEILAGWSEVEAAVGRVTAENRNRTARLKGLGNAQVPLQAATAFSILWEMMEITNE